ncbi:dihydropteroate synthase [Henriciella aquimarina]|uniref:dihydropteroate synthase n=1 Tax=Henriciella aquimarina TaxID=545261 RepID=UPI000A0090E2|nr:dihydropteroate synthase [Henriciella aquimarina]
MMEADHAKLRDWVMAEARKRTLIMGILNVTPDSFSDGGEHDGVADAIAHACLMTSQGADIIDIGGESTRPGATPVSAEEELARTIPVVEAVSGHDRAPVSIDTYKASVARAAAKAGAVILNDVSGLSDPDMVHAAAETGSALVITYNRGAADGSIDAARDMLLFFEAALQQCAAASLPPEHVILDPGVGFGKTYEQNFTVLGHVPALVQFECPVLIGVSRKSFIGKLYDNKVEDRLIGTLAAGLDSVRRGAHMLRVHDVAEHKQAISMWEAIDYAAD